MQRVHEPASAENVASYLERQYLPVLPLEGILIQAKFKQLSDKQAEIARDLNDAMSQTSETWHDNAPADVANLASNLNAVSAEKLINAMRGAVILDYPQSAERGTLGNLLHITNGDGKTRSLFLAGYAPDIKDYLKPEIDVITLKSPVGDALIGAEAGEQREYKVGRRVLSVTLDRIEPPISAFAAEESLHYDLERD